MAGLGASGGYPPVGAAAAREIRTPVVARGGRPVATMGAPAGTAALGGNPTGSMVAGGGVSGGVQDGRARSRQGGGMMASAGSRAMAADPYAESQVRANNQSPHTFK